MKSGPYILLEIIYPDEDTVKAEFDSKKSDIKQIMKNNTANPKIHTTVENTSFISPASREASDLFIHNGNVFVKGEGNQFVNISPSEAVSARIFDDLQAGGQIEASKSLDPSTYNKEVQICQKPLKGSQSDATSEQARNPHVQEYYQSVIGPVFIFGLLVGVALAGVVWYNSSLIEREIIKSSRIDLTEHLQPMESSITSDGSVNLIDSFDSSIPIVTTEEPAVALLFHHQGAPELLGIGFNSCLILCIILLSVMVSLWSLRFIQATPFYAACTPYDPDVLPNLSSIVTIPPMAAQDKPTEVAEGVYKTLIIWADNK